MPKQQKIYKVNVDDVVEMLAVHTLQGNMEVYNAFQLVLPELGIPFDKKAYGDKVKHYTDILAKIEKPKKK